MKVEERGDHIVRHEIRVGDKATITKAFNEAEVLQYAELSTDHNPLHFDRTYAAGTVFAEPIVHGLLVASLFSGLLGMKLPGKGTVYLGQTLSFTAPVRVGEEVTASVEVLKVREDKPIVTLRTLCINSRGETAIDGEAVVKIL